MRSTSHAEPVSGADGMVVAPDPRAAKAGLEILAAGGNAFDAAVATAFATGVVEPFMSGVGGGTWLTARMGDTGQRIGIEGPMVAPGAASPDMFELVPDGDVGDGLYGWPSVVGGQNVHGALSVAVPGSVAALAEASRFGVLGLEAAMQPAIALAAEGVEANWLMTSCIVNEMSLLRQDPKSADLFLPGGIPLSSAVTRSADVLVQPELAATLRRIAIGGAEEFYRGQTAKALVAFIQSAGGILSLEDLASYSATVQLDPARWEFEGFSLSGPMRTGVATVVQQLRLVEEQRRGTSAGTDAVEAVRWAAAMSIAFADRLEFMSASPDAETPWEELLSAEGAKARLAESHLAEMSGGPAGCTSHITVVDRDGTVVSLTQTVLDLFGSRLVDPVSGVLLNDGMMYFDPRPDAKNAVKSGVAGLSAVSPIIVETPTMVFGVGASGGRKIMTCVAQLIDAVVTSGLGLQQAIERPRIHVEGQRAYIRHGQAEVRSALGQKGYDVVELSEQPTTWHFARPNGAMQGDSGMWISGVDPYKPFGVETI